jgi:hypothetical protein
MIFKDIETVWKQTAEGSIYIQKGQAKLLEFYYSIHERYVELSPVVNLCSKAEEVLNPCEF